MKRIGQYEEDNYRPDTSNTYCVLSSIQHCLLGWMKVHGCIAYRRISAEVNIPRLKCSVIIVFVFGTTLVFNESTRTTCVVNLRRSTGRQFCQLELFLIVPN